MGCSSQRWAQEKRSRCSAACRSIWCVSTMLPRTPAPPHHPTASVHHISSPHHHFTPVISPPRGASQNCPTEPSHLTIRLHDPKHLVRLNDGAPQPCPTASRRLAIHNCEKRRQIYRVNVLLCCKLVLEACSAVCLKCVVVPNAQNVMHIPVALLPANCRRLIRQNVVLASFNSVSATERLLAATGHDRWHTHDASVIREGTGHPRTPRVLLVWVLRVPLSPISWMQAEFHGACKI